MTAQRRAMVDAMRAMRRAGARPVDLARAANVKIGVVYDVLDRSKTNAGRRS
ncbi:MAG: hypothetical protein KIS86_06850 [Devosia sp.]|nr:hypothetical protein [Devosia sp.]